MKYLIAISIIIGLLSCEKSSEKLPNIIILYADDMGYGDLSIQNPEAKLTTPNLDQLARDGIRFTDGHSSSGICTPSRFALLTGQYHWRRFHGIVGPFGPSVFEANELTLPRMLKEYGYSTACIGKWHLGWDWESLKRPDAEATPVSDSDRRMAFGPEDFDWSQSIPNGPLDQGFDYYFGDGTINFPPYAFIENDRFVVEPSEAFDLRGMQTKEGNWEFRPGPMARNWDPYRVLPAIRDKAIEWISKQDKNTPFFLYVPFTSPHAPIIPNDEFDEKTQAGAFGDFVFETDFIAGEILTALDQTGFSENTIVIFTAENGPEHYEYPRIQNFGHSSMGHLRGLKRDIYEGGHRVPFIIRWPGKIESGKVSDVLIHQVDIFRTIHAIVCASGDPSNSKKIATDAWMQGFLSDSVAIDGINQLPYLLGETDNALRTQAVHNTFANGFVMRKGEWALIDRFTGHHTDVPEWYLEQYGYGEIHQDCPGQLYNLKEDPSQKINLFEENPEKVEELRQILQSEKDRRIHSR